VYCHALKLNLPNINIRIVNIQITSISHTSYFNHILWASCMRMEKKLRFSSYFHRLLQRIRKPNTDDVNLTILVYNQQSTGNQFESWKFNAEKFYFQN